MRFIILAAVLILAASQIQGAHAWSIKNHHEIAESVYHAMPEDVRSKLSLDEMKNGADDPDTVFFDFKYHTYPYTTQKASFWLNQGKSVTSQATTGMPATVLVLQATTYPMAYAVPTHQAGPVATSTPSMN